MTPDSVQPLLNMDQVKIHPHVALSLPAALALRRQILPFSISEDQVFVACADLDDLAGLDAVQKLTGRKAVARLAERESLRRAIARVYADSHRGLPSERSLSRRKSILTDETIIRVEVEDAVELANQLIHAAILQQASDIHVEPSKDYVKIRFRVDGELTTYRKLPSSCLPSLISRLKVLSGMDIAEKRSPQDGGFSHAYGVSTEKRFVDIRTATLPTKYGERMTLRLLALRTDSLTLDNLGMSPGDHAQVQQLLKHPHGLVLLTGPTGSGKTTTLYAIIRQLAAGSSLNIVTIEDPIEYEIEGASQTEVEAGDKVNFTKRFRSVLRHDPDVLMIGEIRDVETLDVAIKASLTGHLVLSTLHTNSAAGVVTRLHDMGAQRFLIAATLRLCVAQRLVRRLCQHSCCKRPRSLTNEEAKALDCSIETDVTVYEPGGCIYCDGRGYSGRVGIFELMPVNTDVGARIAAGDTEDELERLRLSQGRASLRLDAASKVLAGLVSFGDAVELFGVM